MSKLLTIEEAQHIAICIKDKMFPNGTRLIDKEISMSTFFQSHVLLIELLYYILGNKNSTFTPNLREWIEDETFDYNRLDITNKVGNEGLLKIFKKLKLAGVDQICPKDKHLYFEGQSLNQEDFDNNPFLNM